MKKEKVLSFSKKIDALVAEEAKKRVLKAREGIRPLLAVTNKDCLTTGTLLNENGETCAVGAIMLAAGVKPMVGQGSPTDAQRKKLEKFFPILGEDDDLLEDIMRVNDAVGKKGGVAKRRAAVRAALLNAVPDLEDAVGGVMSDLSDKFE